jgi:hypothetical protein
VGKVLELLEQVVAKCKQNWPAWEDFKPYVVYTKSKDSIQVCVVAKDPENPHPHRKSKESKAWESWITRVKMATGEIDGKWKDYINLVWGEESSELMVAIQSLHTWADQQIFESNEFFRDLASEFALH